MQNIFVQIKCELGKVYEVAEALVDNIEETEDLYSISGKEAKIFNLPPPCGLLVQRVIVSSIFSIASTTDKKPQAFLVKFISRISLDEKL